MSFTYSSASTATGSPPSAIPMSTPLISSIANVKDSRWLTLEVCREYQRGKCTRTEQECKFAHPPSHVEVNNGKVIACFDSLKGKCNRSNPPCKYLHPTQHLRDVLIQNGRNNLILRSIAMNLAANPSIYPQTAIPSPYANGAILPQTLPQTATLSPYHHLAGSGAANAGPSTLVFNQAGQAFSIPIQSLQQGTAMYASDGTSYFSPMTQLTTATGPGPKTTRTDRLEVCAEFQQGRCLYTSETCLYAHPPAHCPLDAESLVTVCVDYVKGKCARETCKYFHPPGHLVAQLKAIKAQSAAAAHVYSTAANGMPFSSSAIQYLQPIALNNNGALLTAYPSQTSNETIIASSSASSPLASATVHDDDGGNFPNGYLSAYQTYPGALQTIYTTDIKEPTLITGNADVSASQEIKAVDHGSNSSSNASQTKKRPLEDDTAPPTGAYLQLPPGTQLLATAAAPPQYLHPGANSPSATQQQQHQKRSAIADPKTGIPVAAYPMPTFSYPSTSSLPIQFQPSYLTAVPMAYLPSPDVVAAQGALVSVGSSYVTYIDKKGQVRELGNSLVVA